MAYFSEDPAVDFDRWDAEQQAALERLPECAECGEPIQDEVCYALGGVYICPDCLETVYRVYTEDCIR